MPSSICQTLWPPLRPGESLEMVFGYPAGGGASDGALLFPPSPLLGGDMDNNVTAGLAHWLPAAGLPVLRFNYRGVGHSRSLGDGPAYEHWLRVEQDDRYEAVLADAAEALLRAQRLFQPRVLVGYSFGAFVALAAARQAGLALPLILIAPPPGRLETAGLADYPGPALVITGGADTLGETEVVCAAAHHALALMERADHFFRGDEPELARRILGFLGRPTGGFTR